MLKKLLVAAIAAGSLTVAGGAHAAVVRSGCGFDAVAQETATGGQDTFTGGAYGYAVFDDQGTHTLRCYITVDGVEQATTPTQSGVGFVATAGQVTYNAAEGATVDECTEIDGATVSCGPADEQQIPPQEVIDAIDSVFDTVNGLACVAVIGCEDVTSTVCIAVSGCNNDTNAQLCIAVQGCNNSTNGICIAGSGCNSPNALVDQVVNAILYGPDAVICPALQSLAPGIPGVIDITPEGDTTVAVIGPFWDCPPYGNLS